MADTKISALSSGAPAQATDEYVVARSGANYKLTATQLLALANVSTVSKYLAPESAAFPASNYPQFKSVSGTNFPVNSLAYDSSTSETAFFKFAANEYASGSLTIRIRWYADSASSGGVAWGVSLAAITPNTDSQDIETKAFDTEEIVVDTHLGTTDQRLHEAVLTLAETDSLASNDEVIMRVARKPADAGDDMTGDALLVSLVVEYSRY